MAGLITGIAGAVISAGTTAASFIQAGQQRRKQQDFEADAARALAEARKKLQVNYAEAMSVNKEPYNQERLAMLSAGAQLAQAAAESRRGVGAAAGQILASQQGVQQDISNRQGVDMQNIQNAILEEESRLRDVNVGLDVQEIAGQQQAAADAKLAAQMATQQGIQGIGNTVGAGLSLIPLYGGFGSKDSETPVAPSAITPADTTVASATPLVTVPQKTSIPSFIDPSKFKEPGEALRYGYVWDRATNGYVPDKSRNFTSPFDIYQAPKTIPEFKSQSEAAAAGYVWDDVTMQYVKPKYQSFF
jgi:hypothetical protein